MIFTVSVVIPVYNVALFVEKAINSALDQPEVIEVLVVDDGSTDETIRIVERIQSSNSKVKLFQHELGINKGRSATRNLGIQKATGNYIAFLDADDFYLIDRFKKDKEILEKKTVVDGVYNAVGFHYYRTVSESEKTQNKVNTLSRPVLPEELFDCLVSSKYGYLHLNGLTVKKTVFGKVGFFNEDLMVAEDSDLLYKLALKCQLVGSSIDELIAKRGVHENNIFDKKEIYNKYNPIFYEEILNWCLNNKIEFHTIDLILKSYWIVRYRVNNTVLKEIFYWMGYLLRHPKILFSKYSIKYFPIIRLRQKLFPFLYKR